MNRRLLAGLLVAALGVSACGGGAGGTGGSGGSAGIGGTGGSADSAGTAGTGGSGGSAGTDGTGGTAGTGGRGGSAGSLGTGTGGSGGTAGTGTGGSGGTAGTAGSAGRGGSGAVAGMGGFGGTAGGGGNAGRGGATGVAGTGGSGGTANPGGMSGGGGTGGGGTRGTGTGGAGGAAAGTTGSAGSGGTGGAPAALRFVAMGDTGKGNPGQFQVGSAIAAWCATHACDFVVLLGDNIYESGVTGVSDSQWQTKFEQPYAAINLPFYAVLGNHDYGANGAGTEFAKGQFEVDYSAVSTKWRMPATHYRFSRPGVDLFAANTNLSVHLMDGAVRADFDAWLPASSATWKVVLGHHPYRSNGPHGNAGSYDGVPSTGPDVARGAGVKAFVEDRVCGRADVYLSGHDHSDQWLTARCGASSSHPGTELIVAGAGASPTTLKTSGPDFNNSYFQSLELGFLYVEIVNRSFTGTFVGTGGNVLYTRSFTK